ncbi:MAG: GNAT family N-acetyltransferase [Bacteroidota bacterium]|nr:GNAT family N-acetyltransferase [Bacteroidota bacterium]
MPDHIKIRPIIVTDDAMIAAIIRTSLDEFGAAKPGTVYFDETTDHLHDVFKQAGSAYFVAEEENKILGGAGIFPTQGLPGHTCELVKMYLSKEARGKGLGKILLEKCMSEAKKMGYKKMYLESMPELKTAISMYNNLGFKNIEKALGNSGHGGCTVWMIKDL